MTSTLVDTNVLVDIIANPDPASWSVQTLRKCAEAGELVINTVIWSEISGAYPVEPMPEVLFRGLILKIENLPVDAGYPAGAAHVAYRRAGGLRERTLPDFLIGAHAAVRGFSLMTRDDTRYRRYFPDLDIVAPTRGAGGAVSP